MGKEFEGREQGAMKKIKGKQKKAFHKLVEPPPPYGHLPQIYNGKLCC
jgi:hypothetical protein